MQARFALGMALMLLSTAPAAAQIAPFSQSSVLPKSNAPNYWAGYYQGEGGVQPASFDPNQQPNQPAPAPLTAEEAAGVADGSCLDACCEGTLCCDRWFGSLAGLILGRDNPNPFWTTYESNNNPNQVMNTEDASADWSGGAEVRFGRWFDCGWLASDCCNARNGLEVVYFFVSPMDGFYSVRGDQFPAGTVSSTIDLQDPTTPSGNVEIGGNDSATYFDGAAEQRIWRQDEVHNIEINFLRQRLDGSAVDITWLVGIRYFRFNEGLIYGSVEDGFNFGDNGGANEAYLNIQSTNDLLGPQIGVRMDYQLWNNFGLYATPKMGIFGNRVHTRAHLYSGDGLEGYDIYGNACDFSFLAQIDAGVNYAITDNWRVFLGYRLIAVSGITLSDNQFPHYLAATDELAVPDTNGDLILHGGMAGVEFRY